MQGKLDLWMGYKAPWKKAPRKAVFIHIQKTAGSSLVHLAKHQYGQNSVSSHGDFYKGYSDEKNFISGHFGATYAERYLADRFSFTFLRDPIDRVISLYNFCRTRDPNEFPIYAMVQSNRFGDLVSKCSTRPSKGSPIEAVIHYESLWKNITWQLAYGWSHDIFEVNRTTQLILVNLSLLIAR